MKTPVPFRPRPLAWVLPSLIALSASALGVRHAAAARPLATDDAGVLAAGDCEAEAYANRLNLRGSGRENSASAQIGCGLGANAQADLAYGRSNQPDADNRGHKESVSANAQLRLLETPGGHAVALAAGSSMGRTGREAFQFDSINLNAIWTAPLSDRWTSHANLGWARKRSDSTQRTTWNLALEYQLKQGLDAGAELYGDDRSRPWLGLGLRFACTEKLVFGASYAAQSASLLRPRLFSLGVTAGF